MIIKKKKKGEEEENIRKKYIDCEIHAARFIVIRKNWFVGNFTQLPKITNLFIKDFLHKRSFVRML